MIKLKGNFKMPLEKFIRFITDLQENLIFNSCGNQNEEMKLYEKHNISINLVYSDKDFFKDFPEYEDERHFESASDILDLLFKNYVILYKNFTDNHENMPMYIEDYWIYDFDKESLLVANFDNYSSEGDYLLLDIYELSYEGEE